MSEQAIMHGPAFSEEFLFQLNQELNLSDEEEFEIFRLNEVEKGLFAFCAELAQSVKKIDSGISTSSTPLDVFAVSAPLHRTLLEVSEKLVAILEEKLLAALGQYPTLRLFIGPYKPVIRRGFIIVLSPKEEDNENLFGNSEEYWRQFPAAT